MDQPVVFTPNREFVLPPLSRDEVQPVFNFTLDSFCEGDDGIVTATGVVKKNCTRLEVVATPVNGGEAIQAPLTKTQRFSYRERADEGGNVFRSY